jgi:hypothetical protein
LTPPPAMRAMIRPASPPTASRCGRPAIADSCPQASSWLCLYHVLRADPPSPSPQPRPCARRSRPARHTAPAPMARPYTFTRQTAERGVAEFGPLSSDQVLQHAPRASGRSYDPAEVLAMALRRRWCGPGDEGLIGRAEHHDPARPSTRRSKGAGCSLSSGAHINSA